MPDLPRSVHSPAFDYGDLGFQLAAAAAKARSDGHCRICGRKRPLDAHHWRPWPYRPAAQTKADELIGLCREGCHDLAHGIRIVHDLGFSPELFRIRLSETIADLLRPVDDGRRIGRAVTRRREWIAIVSGATEPHAGEVFWLALRSKDKWVTVAVTDVIDGPSGYWRVRKEFLPRKEEVRLPMRTADGAGQPFEQTFCPNLAAVSLEQRAGGVAGGGGHRPPASL